jgi:hypothetical protein
MLGRFGIGWKRVAALAGRPEPTVYKLLYGTRTRPPRQKIRPETEAAILAVQPAAGNLAGGARVDGTGSRRRLQALAAAGWPQRWLAGRLGWEWRNFRSVMHHQKHVSAATARAVLALYGELWDQPPPQDTPADRKAVTTARNTAEAHGWLPPQAWDDERIDDPRAAAEDCRRHGRRPQAVLLEEASELITSYGYDLEQAAARLGTTRAALEKAFSRAAATLHALPDATLVAIPGYRRRLQALVALGHPMPWLAGQLGMGRAAFCRLITGPQNWTTAATARAVLALYAGLQDQQPPQDTPGQRQPADAARKAAQARGWLPPRALEGALEGAPLTAFTGPPGLAGNGNRTSGRSVPAVLAASSRITLPRRQQHEPPGGLPGQRGPGNAIAMVPVRRAARPPGRQARLRLITSAASTAHPVNPDRVGAPATPVSGRPAKICRTPSWRCHQAQTS